MAIDELVAVVPPPKRPLEAGPVKRWPAIQQSVGLALPDEYRDFGLTYGTGRFWNGEVQIYNPFSKDYLAIVESELANLRLATDLGLVVPFPVHPEPAGLFPVGRDHNGHSLFWLTQGKPEKWPIIAKPHGFDEWKQYKLPLTTFLARVLTNKTRCVLWMHKFGAADQNFGPID